MSEERTKYSATTKRFDPKHRALAQAFRKKEKTMNLQDNAMQEGDTNYFSCKQTAMESCALNKQEQLPLEPLETPEIPKTELKQSSDCQYSKDDLSVEDSKEQTVQVESIVTVVARSEFIEADFAINVKENAFISNGDIQQNQET